MAKQFSITCTAPVNIAVIKYWGKRDVELNLPLNSSLSGTLHQDDLKTTTTVTASTDFSGDSLVLNDEPQVIKPGSRLDVCLKELRNRAGDLVDEKTGEVLVKKEDWPSLGLQIVSHNNFPTAAGLASSAAGFGCLVASVGKLLNVQGDLTAIARRGSGSASRSLFGGWVKWDVGVLADGSDSIALQVADEKHWEDMRVLIFVVRDEKKDVGSTDGMQQSVATSPLMKERAETIVPQRMAEIEKAILNKDFGTFAQITMVDSDDFHEVCHTTVPPIYYMNDVSRNVVQLVRAYNALFPQPRVAYTYDAGPNAVLYLLKDDVVPFLKLGLHYFPFSDPSAAVVRTRDESLWDQVQAHELPNVSDAPSVSAPDSIKYIIQTLVGPGPIASPLSIQ